MTTLRQIYSSCFWITWMRSCYNFLWSVSWRQPLKRRGGPCHPPSRRRNNTELMAVITLQRVVKEDGGRCLSQSSESNTHTHTHSKKKERGKERKKMKYKRRRKKRKRNRAASLIRTSVKVDRLLAAPLIIFNISTTDVI